MRDRLRKGRVKEGRERCLKMIRAEKARDEKVVRKKEEKDQTK